MPEYDEVPEYDEDPCTSCAWEDSCDVWEAQFCCARCRFLFDDPDCENCDPWDI